MINYNYLFDLTPISYQEQLICSDWLEDHNRENLAHCLKFNYKICNHSISGLGASLFYNNDPNLGCYEEKDIHYEFGNGHGRGYGNYSGCDIDLGFCNASLHSLIYCDKNGYIHDFIVESSYSLLFVANQK